MKRSFSRSVAAMIFLMFELMSLAGCVVRTPCASAGERPATLATLYFGRSMAGGGAVTDAEWRRFLSTVVTPAFPDGFTVSDGLGQWMDQTRHEITSEHSKIVAIVVFNDPRRDAKLATIRQRYDVLFRQESVGLTLAPVCASF